MAKGKKMSKPSVMGKKIAAHGPKVAGAMPAAVPSKKSGKRTMKK